MGKNIAPTAELRKAFNHKEENMEMFYNKYFEELEDNPNSKDFIKLISEKLINNNVTLLYGAKSTVLNQAVVLKDWLNLKLNNSKNPDYF